MTDSSTGGLNWQRLNPWTPVVLGGRALVIVALLGSEEASRGSASREVTIYIGIAILVASIVVGLVRWLVTKWALDGVTLRIETGLFRRDARQLPLVRIQAVDVVRPFLARVFGLAELRIRLAGGGKSGGRLTYLSEEAAVDLRARLMAGHHGLDMATPEPAERPIATVATGRLVASAILQPATLVAVVFVVVLLALESISPKSANGAETGTGLTLGLYLFGLARVTWRRVATEYGFAVAAAPDGIRLKRGLFSTVNETIPFARVQAVRKSEPFTWHFLGWCRLEVDVAGSPGREQGTRSGKVTKALLPVGPVRASGRALFQFARIATVPAVQAPAACTLEVPAQLPLPRCGRQRPGCGGELREAEKGNDLGAPREGPERAPGARTGAAPLAPGYGPRGRGRARRACRVPRQGCSRGGRLVRTAGGAEPLGAACGLGPGSRGPWTSRRCKARHCTGRTLAPAQRRRSG